MIKVLLPLNQRIIYRIWVSINLSMFLMTCNSYTAEK